MEVNAVIDNKGMAMPAVTPPSAKDAIRNLLKMTPNSFRATPSTAQRSTQQQRSNISSARALTSAGRVLGATNFGTSPLDDIPSSAGYLRNKINRGIYSSDFRTTTSPSARLSSETRKKFMFEGPSPSPSRGQQTSLGDNGNIENQYPSPSFNSSFSSSDDTSHRTPHAVETRNRKQLAVYSEQLQMRKIELQAQARVKAAEAEFVAQRSKMQLQLHTETVAGMTYFLLVVRACPISLFAQPSPSPFGGSCYDVEASKLAAEKRQWANAVQLMESEIQSQKSYSDELRTQIEHLQQHQVQNERVVQEVHEVQRDLDRSNDTNASLDLEVQALKHERTQAQEKVELLQSRLHELSRNEQMVARDMQVRNNLCRDVSLSYLYVLCQNYFRYNPAYGFPIVGHS